MMTCTIEHKGFNDMLAGLHEALIGTGQKSDSAELIKQETRLFAKMMVKLTPPAGTGQAAKRLGEMAVENDLNKAFTGISDEMMEVLSGDLGFGLRDSKSKKKPRIAGMENIDAWFTKQDGTKVNLLWKKIDPTGKGMANFHNAHRDARGRVAYLSRKTKGKEGEWKADYVVREKHLAKYMRDVLKRVGRRKSGWAVALIRMGGKAPVWVNRHLRSNPPGSVQDTLGVINHPSVTVTNYAPGIRDDKHIVQSAMYARMNAIRKKTRLILSRYNSQIRAGMRPRRVLEREAALAQMETPF